MAIPSSIISGTMYWAFLSKKDKYDKYGFDLVLDQDETSLDIVNKLAPGFVKVYTKNGPKYDNKPFIHISSKSYPFRVLMDLDGNGEFKPIPTEQIPLIGNGSTARVKVTPFFTMVDGKKNNKLNAQVIQITNYIPYVKTDTDPLNQFYEFPRSPDKAVEGMTSELDDFL